MSLYWFHLDRLTTLLILLNITLFFVTDLVIKQGYYFTIYSLILLTCVEIGLLLPLGLLDRLWYYCLWLVFEFIALYFLIASVHYWLVNNRI